MTKQCRWPTGCPTRIKSGDYCIPHWQKLYRTGRLRSGFITHTRTRAHVTEYVTRGGTCLSLAQHARVSHTTIDDLYQGVNRRIRVGVADRILAVPMRPSNIGCVRRLNALTALGHPIVVIAAAGGSTVDTFHAALRKARFTDTVAWQASAAFDRLQGTPGRARNAKYVAACAARRGAVPPLAWFDLDIDDPSTVPDLGGPTRVRNPRRRGEAA